ncbi:MAG: ABC transporter substrate-binding protein [Chloroflexi bacterium]|nr:ABC transporter substrate-binding protein [Chloroflexota bacterium]
MRRGTTRAHPWRWPALTGLVLAALTLLVASGPHPARAARQESSIRSLLAGVGAQLQPVRVGIVAIASEVGLFLAQERGYLAEQGLTADFVRFEGGAQVAAPLSIGELEVGSGPVSAALFNGINRGLEVRIAAPQSRYEPGYSQLWLSVRQDLADTVRDYPDLRGRTIAVLTLASTSELLVERALQRGGLSLNDVSLVQLGPGDQLTAFANRAIDAGLLIEPQATIAADRGLATRWREAAEWSPGVQVSNILYGPNFTQRNVDAGQRFMLAYLKGVRDYYDAIIAGRGDREAVIATLMRYTPLQDRALYDRMRWAYLDPNLALDEDDLRATMQWFVARGLVDRPVDLATAVDRRFADYALSALGPHP